MEEKNPRIEDVRVVAKDGTGVELTYIYERYDHWEVVKKLGQGVERYKSEKIWGADGRKNRESGDRIGS